VSTIAELTEHADRSLLIVEDDKPFLERLARAMESRGFTVTSCDSVSDGLAQIGRAAPAFAVVDLRLGDGNGLDVVSALKRKRPDARAIVLTGYGNIATAVTAVKLGAVDYLSKPADADDVVAALLASGNEKSELPSNPMSADRVRWEHIQRIYEMCNRNVSETARRLNMHRRTLQRILAKRAPRERFPNLRTDFQTSWCARRKKCAGFSPHDLRPATEGAGGSAGRTRSCVRNVALAMAYRSTACPERK
jgi:two-component system response regulator RegA